MKGKPYTNYNYGFNKKQIRVIHSNNVRIYPLKAKIIQWKTISNDKIKCGLFLLSYFILSSVFIFVKL